jgi:prepilin-type N-terminal cleavage/methylation domain-containing protein
MKRYKGFTLIELLIVIVIVLIIASIIIPNLNLFPQTICRGGYLFSNGEYGQQIIDENGRGIPCK